MCVSVCLSVCLSLPPFPPLSVSLCLVYCSLPLSPPPPSLSLSPPPPLSLLSLSPSFSLCSLPLLLYFSGFAMSSFYFNTFLSPSHFSVGLPLCLSLSLSLPLPVFSLNSMSYSAGATCFSFAPQLSKGNTHGSIFTLFISSMSKSGRTRQTQYLIIARSDSYYFTRAS